MGRIISPSLGSSRLSRRHGQRIGFAPNSPYLFSGSGPAWSPASLSNLVQRFLDQSPTYHASTLQSFPILSPEETGTVAVPRGQRCALFDGVNDFGQTASALATGTTPTITMWFKASALSGRLCNARDGSGNGFDIYFNSSKVNFYNAQSGVASQTSTLSTGTWYHLAIVVDGSTLRFYLNGVADGTAVCGFVQSSAVFTLGSYGGANFFNGSMRDVRVYNVVKSPTEIAAIANQHLTPSTIDTAGLLAMYPMQAESGTIGYDVSGNGRHLTLTNITQSTFHATDSGVNWNYNNWRGHTLGRNMLARSQEISNAAPWNSDGGALSFSANSIVAPDGTTTAETASFANGGLDFFYQLVNSGSSGARYTFSIYLRSLSGTVNIGLRESATNTWRVVTATTSWQRFTMTFTASSSMNIGMDQRAVAVTGATATGSVAVWGAQLEPGEVATDYQTTGATGYTPGTIIPASLATPTQDAAGNALGVAGPVAKPATVEVPCVTGDGSAVYCDLGSALIPATADFAIEFSGYLTSSFNKTFVDQRTNASDRFFIGFETAGKIKLQVAGGTAVESSTLASSNWYRVRATRVGNVFTLLVDEVNQGSTTVSATIASANTYLLGIGSLLTYYNDGRICDLRITTGGVTTFFPLQAGPGTSNTNRDLHFVRSDGTSGVVANAIVNGTVSSILANRCPHVRDWCIEYGGGIAANGAFVPGRIGSNLDAAGNTKTLVPGKHGNPYSRINRNRWSAPELVNIGITSSDSVAPSTNVQAASVVDTQFARRKTDGSDRYFAAQSPLTGPDKTNAEGYIA